MGHSKQLSLLKRLVENKRLPSSLIFSGPDGVGKKTVALELAKSVAGKFETRLIGEKSPPTIDDFRQLKSWLFSKPTVSEKKFLIIDNFHLARVELSNAVLKTLEEPPEYAHIVLVALSEHSVAPTVLSRSTVIRFSSLTPQNVAAVLKRLGVEPEEKVLKFCGGSVSRALNLTSSAVIGLLSEFSKLLKSGKLPYELVSFSEKFSKLTRDEAMLFLDALESVLSPSAYLQWAECLTRARDFLLSFAKPQSAIEWMLLCVLNSASP